MIRASQLQYIAPGLTDIKATALSNAINTLAPKYCMDVPAILQHFISQIAHESMGFRVKEENLNYSAKRLTEVWGSRFKTLAAAQPYAGQPRKLSNLVYGGRMGNVNPDDGWNFRGGGYKQLTGRNNYTAYWNDKGKPTKTVEEFADLVRADENWAMDSAFWYWDKNKLSRFIGASNDEVLAITKAINGGAIGLAERKRLYQKAKAVIV